MLFPKKCEAFRYYWKFWGFFPNSGGTRSRQSYIFLFFSTREKERSSGLSSTPEDRLYQEPWLSCHILTQVYEPLETALSVEHMYLIKKSKDTTNMEPHADIFKKPV